MNKELTIDGFDKIDRLIVGKWMVEYINTDTSYYNFNLYDGNSSWNYPFIECKLSRNNLLDNGYPLTMQYYNSPSTIIGGPVIVFLGKDELLSAKDFLNVLKSMVISHFNNK